MSTQSHIVGISESLGRLDSVNQRLVTWILLVFCNSNIFLITNTGAGCVSVCVLSVYLQAAISSSSCLSSSSICPFIILVLSLSFWASPERDKHMTYEQTLSPPSLSHTCRPTFVDWLLNTTQNFTKYYTKPLKIKAVYNIISVLAS